MKRLLGIAAVASALTAMLIGAAACGGKQSPTAGATETAPGEADKTAADTGEPAAEGLGMAQDATVLAEDGSHVQLQSAWLNTHAVLIFLRGHW